MNEAASQGHSFASRWNGIRPSKAPRRWIGGRVPVLASTGGSGRALAESGIAEQVGQVMAEACCNPWSIPVEWAEWKHQVGRLPGHTTKELQR